MVWHIEIEDFNWEHLPNFGIYHLNIAQSADFLVKILAFEGEFDFDFDDEENYNIYDDHYSKIFSKIIDEYQGYIIKAVLDKKLKAKKKVTAQLIIRIPKHSRI